MHKLNHRAGIFLAFLMLALLISGIGFSIHNHRKEAGLKKELENSPLKSSAARREREILAMHLRNEGFIKGHAAGIDSAVRGEAARSQGELHEIALRAAPAISAGDREQWAHGFEAGFAEGFEHVVKRGF
jgi:flagellar biosynthesis/type III secretory pathway protein FliH